MKNGLQMRIWRDERGIIRREIAVFMIALVIVAAVFAHTALFAGFFSAEKSQKPVYSGLRGSAIANALYELDNCEDAWTASTDVVAARDLTSYVEGTASTNFMIGDGLTSGVVGYHDIAGDTNALDLSGCSSVTFWIKSSSDIGDDILQLRLRESNDDTGTMENFAIPGSALDGSGWHKVTAELSGTTTSYDAVKSVALYAVSNPGEVDIWLDIIETQPILTTSNPVKAHADKGVLTVGNLLVDSPPTIL